MNADGFRVVRGVIVAGCGFIVVGCGGTVASVHIPPLPEPTTSKFESFDAWDARVNHPTTTTAPTTESTP
jgi:hypothetical protein